MKRLIPVFLLLLSACSSPSDPASASQNPTSSTAPTLPAAPESATTGTAVSANGTVEAVDVAAGTVTIAHAPIDALQWPAMSMAFKAPGVDLTALRKGDHIVFEIAPRETGHVITKITKR